MMLTMNETFETGKDKTKIDLQMQMKDLKC